MSDKEYAINNAIETVFPNMLLLICWNLIIRATKGWLRKKVENSENISVYISQIRKLLENKTEEQFHDLLSNQNSNEEVSVLRNVWSLPFVEYYYAYLDKVSRVGG